jgi:hypothetical protein
MIYSIEFIGKPVPQSGTDRGFVDDGLSKYKIIPENGNPGFQCTPAEPFTEIIKDITVAFGKKQKIPGRHEVKDGVCSPNTEILYTKNKNPVAQ